MTIETLFYFLGIVYFIIGLIFMCGILIALFIAYQRFERLKTEVQQSAAVVGVTKIASMLSQTKTLSILSAAPIVLSGIKLFQKFRGNRHST